VLLGAAARAVLAGVDLRVTLLGDGAPDYRARLERLASSVALEGRVEMLGRQDRASVSRALSTAHVFVLPSLWPEPFGLATLEALGHGCCALVSDAGASPEIVRDGVDGLVVPAGDESALAAALQRLANDDGLRVRLASAGQARARDDFDHGRFVAALEAALADVAGAPVA
jgi:glycosyltransferase involved in cell wall biosynthesis